MQKGCLCSGPLSAKSGHSPGVARPVFAINGSVGQAGKNAAPDVKLVQTSLNRLASSEGGPVAALSVDGRCGDLTKAAIRRFQKKHFAGVEPDGLIEPGKRTISKLEEVLFFSRIGTLPTQQNDWLLDFLSRQNNEITNAYLAIPESKVRIEAGIAGLNYIRNTFSTIARSPGTITDPLHRAFNWHFKGHKLYSDPRKFFAHVDYIAEIIGRMKRCLNFDRPNMSGEAAKNLFLLGLPTNNYVGWALLNGFDAFPGDTTTAYTRDDVIVPSGSIYVHPGRTLIPLVLIHELAHFCGKANENNSHYCHPDPWPEGHAGEAPYDYRGMPPEIARLNTYSYQCWMFPDFPYAQVPVG